MLKPKILINEHIRNRITEERIKSGKSGIAISKDIGKSDAWVSLLENGRILSVKSSDLINLFKELLSINEEESEKYIEDLIKSNSKESSISDNNHNKEKLNIYDKPKDLINEDNFKKFVKDINAGLKFAFKNNEEYTFNQVVLFTRNMHFDLGFMLALMSFPYYKLDKLGFEDRQNFLEKVYELIKDFSNTTDDDELEIEFNK
ncbi:hypothetical protein [Pseudobacteroides cellulosolvens]|uniref:Uncharacterized protein n=1 Tax=Pseudobacteroides cellulosolvens ATCC 35603 = DSM 2933 TaxID=398512 RepID=A0A0L6JLS6_9FIRM|nr:hypothetical protein [Pseudobacteroides cellulosolvens]KNY26352.1 hypothetical protein Bccel_1614 [Pseudobacteroides cellulosolvens ATCC 35603 = DSM 2933]